MARFVATWVAASLLPLGTTARPAAGEPPAEGAWQAIRQRLIEAHRAATSIHRGYEVEVDGTLWFRTEIFREGRLHGVHSELAKTPGATRAGDFATDGSRFVARYDDEPRRLSLPSLRPADPRTGRFRAAQEALCLMEGVEAPRPPEGDFRFDLRLPYSAESASTEPAPNLGVHVRLEWGAPPVPNWLDEDALGPRTQAEDAGGDLLPVRIEGYDALVHRTDGCVAWIEGYRVPSNRHWVLREVPPRITRDGWRARIADLCRATEEELDAWPADDAACLHLLRALDDLYALPVFRPEDAPQREAVVDVLCDVAWADGDTTRQWWAEVGRAQRATAAARSSGASAAWASRMQAARDDLIHEVQDRLCAQGNWPIRSAGEEVEGQARRWIAARLELLWDEYRRLAAARGGR